MFNGSMVAIATPMFEGVAPETRIDFDAFTRLIELHIDSKSDAIVVAGTTGESATLSEKEHCELIRHAVKVVHGRVPVIAGTGANSTAEALRLTACAKSAGADAALLVTPYYNKPTQEGLYQHYKLIAKIVDLPQLLYNVPGRTACDMQVETVSRLARLGNIIGIKEATAELTRVNQLRDLCPDDFLILSGDDLTSKDFLLQGGGGVISVTANVAPRLMHEMCTYAIAGNKKKAAELDAILAGLHQALFVEANPIPVKYALHKMRLIQAGIRLPLTWLPTSLHGQLQQAMQQAHII